MSATGRVGGRRPLDRYYTPDAVADACVRALPALAPRTIVEPSVGGGAFRRALYRRWPTARIVGVDADPDAIGLAESHRSIIGDWPTVAPTLRADLVCGNPPYRHAEAHLRAACQVAPVVAMLLRLAWLESAGRWDLHRELGLSRVVVLSERPSFTADGKTDSAAYALFVYEPGRNAGAAALDVLSWREGRGLALEVPHA